MRLLIALIIAQILVARAADTLVEVPELGLRIAPGFKVTLFADADLANDIQCMTLDAKGRVVVSGPGYIRQIEDTNSDGRADHVVKIASTRTGAMGMCYDGSQLIYFADGALNRLPNADGDGPSTNKPEKLKTLSYGEHGAHAMRIGPDGSWYWIGGNDSRFQPAQWTSDRSPITQPAGGAIVRMNRRFGESEVIAQGFRNPYDFDFDPTGEIITYDSDTERDFLLPWYTPTRIYHVGYAQHHGWRLSGYTRSWARRDYYLDTVDIAFPVGRGSPTGVVCCRNRRFPEHYQGGTFALDWTFGKVWFAGFTRKGAGYSTQGELFLEPSGTQGFAPTDAVFAPDGSLLICTGGRKTRGAIYRIQSDVRVLRREGAGNALLAVLNAEQPLDAWSRAKWEPMADTLGASAFVWAALNKASPENERIRAIEILVDRFGGVPADAVKSLAISKSSLVRARAAWAIGRRSVAGTVSLLGGLAQDSDPWVRRMGMEAMVGQKDLVSDEARLQAVRKNLGDEDKRCFLAAVSVAREMGTVAFDLLAKDAETWTLESRLGLALVAMERNDPRGVDWAWNWGSEVLESKAREQLGLKAVRLWMLAMGDWNLEKPGIELYSGYAPVKPLDQNNPELRKRIINGVLANHLRTDEPFASELARFMAMAELDFDVAPSGVLSHIT